jgi:hypothetical protein
MTGERTMTQHLPEITGTDPVIAARTVLDTGTAHLVDGVLLDHFTASAIASVADKLSPTNRAKLVSMSLPAAAELVWQILAQLG